MSERVDLEAAWIEAWQAIGVSPPDGLLEALLDADHYGGPSRAYHGRAHLEALLADLAQWRSLAERPAEVALAIFFHDAIYDAKAKDNEEQSATLAEQALAAAGAPGDVAARVRDLVLATLHGEPPTEPDARLLVDLDLSILAAPEAAFDAYDAAIRTEYFHVPARLYRAGRAQVLRSFLTREPLFSHEPIRRAREAAARENLARAIDRLEGAGARP